MIAVDRSPIRYTPGPGALTAKLLIRLGGWTLHLVIKMEALWTLCHVETLIAKNPTIFLMNPDAPNFGKILRICGHLEDLCW